MYNFVPQDRRKKTQPVVDDAIIAKEQNRGRLNETDLHVRPSFYPSSRPVINTQAFDSHILPPCYNFPVRKKASLSEQQSPVLFLEPSKSTNILR